MINSFERGYLPHLRECDKKDSCFNNLRCTKCIHSGQGLSDYYAPLKMVRAVIDGRVYPVLSGWFWSNEHGLLSKGSHLVANEDAVHIPGCGAYYKVTLSTDRDIKVFPI